MEDIVKKIAKQINETEAKVYVALNRLSLLYKIENPKPRWEKTALGIKWLKSDYIDKLVLDVTDEIDIMEETPITKSKRKYPTKKQCPNCGLTLNSQNFGYSERYDDGLTKWCLNCLERHNQNQHYG